MSDNYRLNYRGLQTYTDDLKVYIKDSMPKVMSGATKLHDGKSGLTPTPLMGDQNKFLKGDGTWSDIPSFISLYDVNENQLEVGQDETEISFIECNLYKKVDLEGHFTVSLFASENCNVHIRIKDDNVTEIFTPQVYEVPAGYSSIGIPHAYIGKNSGLHNFTVTMQCSNGNIIIPTRGLLYTIFGSIDDSYLNYGIDIIDMSIKRTTNSTPSEFWVLGYEENHLMLRNNDYNDPNANKWNDIYDFGEANGGAIEFYGDWDEIGNKNSLITENEPFIFVIDKKGDLYVYRDGNYENRTLLSSNVSKVSVCMGYKSNLDPSLDQGMIVAYIRNGNVYYKQYRDFNGENIWDYQEELYNGKDAIDINVQRLPDYRMGILVTNSSESKWYITNRTFIGNTYKPENVKSSMCSYSVTNMVPKGRMNENLGVGIKNVFEEKQYHNGFILTFEGNLHFVGDKTIQDLINSLTAKRENVDVAIESVVIEENKLVVTTKNDVQGGANFTISWTLKEFITTNKNGCNMVIPTTSYTWYLPTTNIVKKQSENINAEIGAKLNVAMKPVTRLKNTIVDLANPSISANLNTTMLPIVRNYEEMTETVNSSIGVNLNTSMALIGNKPV